MIQHQFPRRLMTLAYLASIALMSCYAMWLYAMGEYRDLVVPSFMTLLLLTAFLLHLGQDIRAHLPRLVLLACAYTSVMAALYFQPEIPLIWIGLPMTAAFLLLPLTGAVALHLVLVPLWWLMPSLSQAPPTLVMGYIALGLLLALPRWEHARRRALLRATDPNDSECDAYHIDTLKERLHSEYQRADLLNQRLAVLVIHLPQRDMAEEQFGPRAAQALLSALCTEVYSCCRDHDLLGRADNATFWLVLPDTSESGALLVRDRLQHALSRRVLVETGHVEVRIAACLPCPKESFEHYLQRLEARGATLSNV
ncbi:diguanylate cyclase domain-containing protein [Vreelandella arcis]|uniref:GGDEF domain-containing protein, diguanylate cyclase (C-di-GMP synthetase) or its enzymatically inactive variants n=1 Tax=Vreelandella arcis TaxID=416873 RepID=A0A1H0EXE1_9GAMM|nr:diguanylate cyclase [Halomonas arcis]SDN87107.1 GGDEF domain-containing protein, diguanylate cyclase (c-di-GMP synthetase) or its enzymatically inactive variants [Halomonas arcis]